MRTLFVALAIAVCAGCVSNKDIDKRLSDLENRVSTLESADSSKKIRIQRMKKVRSKAWKRIREDSKIYSRSQLKEIQSLYRVANKSWGSKEAKDNLKELIEKFPKSDRAGCAALYLGQMSEDEKDKEEYLKKAIEQYSDCRYGDGVIVGAYARYCLACYYLQKGKKAEADKLFNEIKENYPDAFDHRGYLLADRIKKKQSK